MHKSPSSSSSSFFLKIELWEIMQTCYLNSMQTNQTCIQEMRNECFLKWTCFPISAFFFFKLLSKIFNLFLPLNVINRVIAGPLLWSKLNIARLSFLYLCSFTLALSVRLSTHTNVVISSISQCFFFSFFFSQLNDRLFWDDQTVNHVRRINKNMGWKTTELA